MGGVVWHARRLGVVVAGARVCLAVLVRGSAMTFFPCFAPTLLRCANKLGAPLHGGRPTFPCQGALGSLRGAPPAAVRSSAAVGPRNRPE